MNVKFDTNVLDKLSALTADKPAVLVLDYDYSVHADDIPADSCAMISRIRLLLLDAAPEDFDTKINSNFGVVYAKELAQTFLDPEMSFRRGENGLWQVVGSSVLDSNAQIVDERK
ncbi:MAG: iron-sulfur cluster biosynthesis family protein [Streptococcaceae bacterium]|jgi:uncharacterized protein YqkB|nr:iron-sulfur cluster biosynthesis family protein [Streptococcaceae bacterium]